MRQKRVEEFMSCARRLEEITDECEKDDRIKVRSHAEKGILWSSDQLRRGSKMNGEEVKVMNN